MNLYLFWDFVEIETFCFKNFLKTLLKNFKNNKLLKGIILKALKIKTGH